MDNKTDTKILQSVIKLRDRAPKTKEELDYYLRHFFNVFLAKKSIEPGNSSPLDFVWDIYSTAMGLNPSPIFNFLGMAARGSQKSLSCAVIELLLLTHDKFRDWFHMASIKEQSYVTYEYFRSILSRPIMKGLTSDPTMRQTVSKHGRMLKIGTATMDSVNSFHGSLVQDEVDLTPKVIFSESKGMLSAQQGRMPLNISISSRKFAVGNIQNMIDKFKKDVEFPLKIHKWGILEITEKCLLSRHGTYGVPIYVNEEELIAIHPQELDSIPDTEKSKYNQVIGYENCLKCGIFSFCQGRLPNQDDNNPHLQPIDLTKSLFKTDNPDFFKSQRLNRKPSTFGLIYGTWDEDIHVKTYAQMWQIFHGTPHPDTIPDPTTGRPKRWDIDPKELIKAFIDAGCRCVIGVDFGFSIKAVCGLYFIDGSGRIYFVDELWYQGYSDREVACEMKKNWGHLPVDIVYADPESPGGKKEIRIATGWGTHEKVDKSVHEGIDTVRRFLRTPGTRDTMIYVSPSCAVFREEIPNYRNKIDQRTQEPLPEVHKRNDHSLDQFRYVIHTIFGGIRWDLNFKTQMISRLGEFNATTPTRAPVASELADYLGVKFVDNRADFKPGENNELVPIEDKSNDSETGGSSGFSWSF